MSAKREKTVRRIARNQYNFYYSVWVRNKPSRWRIFRYLKWKREQPSYYNIEKSIKNIVKKKSTE